MFEACEKLAQEGVVGKQIDKCCVAKADMLELGCNNKIISGNIDTTSVSIDGIPLEDFICCKNEKSVYQEVMEYVTSDLSDELWKMLEETEDEEELCLECLVEHYLQKAYSEGYKNGLESIKNKINDIENELLE